MREYGQVQCHFWQSPEALSLTDQGKLLALYLLTGPHSNGLGCYRLPDGYVMADFGWSAETVSKGFDELFQTGFANRLEGVVFVPKFLKWNGIANPNVASARQKEFDALPKGQAKTLLARAMLEFGKHWTSEFETLLQTVSKGLPKQNPTQPKPKEPESTGRKPALSPDWSSVKNLNLKAWQQWVDDRKRRNLAKYKTTREAERLAKLPTEIQAECVDYSLDRYQGLFPEKFAGNKPGSEAESRVVMLDD